MTTRTASKRVALKRRIQQFYELLNQGDFASCFQMIDPRVLAMPNAVTLYQYELSLQQFLAHHGSVKVRDINIEVHLGEPAALYEGRDFAVGKTTWVDTSGTGHIFAERWVFAEGTWCTRCTGFLTPSPESTSSELPVDELPAAPHGPNATRQSKPSKKSSETR